MDSAAALVLCLLSTGTLLQVWGTPNVTAWYGETIVVPCQGEAPMPKDPMFIKWKYVKDDGTSGDLLIKQARNDQETVQATDDYAQRVSIDDQFSLLITQALIKDQKTFTCMVVSADNFKEYPVDVFVNKKPSATKIVDRSEVLKMDKLTTVGTCVVADANPAANIAWKKSGKPLVADGKAVVITQSSELDAATGLSTSSSTLQYSASKEDAGAVFTCVSTYQMSDQETHLGSFPVHYPSKMVSLNILPEGPIVEGDNVTLNCLADGNPPPSSFFFHIKSEKTLVNSDVYNLTLISREATGEYRCSLADNEEVEASQNITVNYINFTLTPAGRIVKTPGEPLFVKMEKSTSGDAVASWTKDGKAVREPEFTQLTYADAGVYRCEVSTTGLKRHQSFELVVEGKPVITNLTQHRAPGAKHKVLNCEAEGVPEPNFQWSIPNTPPLQEDISHINGRVIHTISVIPKPNLTVTCTVSNKLGEDVRMIDISEAPENSILLMGLIVGSVFGLIAAAAVGGLIYWLYWKKCRQRSYTTGEKERGTPEESEMLDKSHGLKDLQC
ncbi:CD166 antigen homolog isoform 2-T2 [Odontesthes bonariensis]|uniref:CD166 antigen homolog isoform X2 n=1 Tax=Odontesthes bonariensis TaxID=219752 RepID=UPI003F58D43D